MTDPCLYRATADSPPRIEVSQPEGSRGSIEPRGDGTGTPEACPTPIYHDPHPPFETDGRGRVVRSNSSGQVRLRSRSSPPVQSRKSSNDETNVTREKENGRTAGPTIEIGGGGHAHGSGDDSGDGDAGVEGTVAEVP